MRMKQNTTVGISGYRNALTIKNALMFKRKGSNPRIVQSPSGIWGVTYEKQVRK